MARRIEAVATQRARTLRSNATAEERKIWALLSRYRPKFTRQLPIGPYIVDFACRTPRMLIVEVDGDTHASQAAYEERRTAFLESKGYRVLRFTNRAVGTNMDGVLMAIADALGLPLSPALSPEGEREVGRA